MANCLRGVRPEGFNRKHRLREHLTNTPKGSAKRGIARPHGLSNTAAEAAIEQAVKQQAKVVRQALTASDDANAATTDPGAEAMLPTNEIGEHQGHGVHREMSFTQLLGGDDIDFNDYVLEDD